MKIAISNLAWEIYDERTVGKTLRCMNIDAIELAPTKIWSSPLEVTREEVRSYRQVWEKEGISIVAMQSLLYGRPDLTVFESTKSREVMLDYLERIMDIAEVLGARCLVFGSPKNRMIWSMPRDEVENIALSFFGELGRRASARGLTLCIEPNPKDYGGDYITNSEEGITLVRKINQEGIGLHLDSGCMTLANDDVEDSIGKAMPFLRHFHISEPLLAEIGTGRVRHQDFAQSLRKNGYSGYVSIEMKPVEGIEVEFLVGRVMELVNSIYA